MIVGTFTKTQTGSFEGLVETLIFSADLVIQPVEKDKDRAPDYRVHAKHNGAEVGAGWNEKSQRTNEPYISLKVDDPSFAYPMWAALTKSETGYALKWSRPRPKSGQDGAATEAEGGDTL